MRQTICDRSGAVIENPGDDYVALEIYCPWLPELHGFKFTDLSDSERPKVAKYLCAIAKRSGEKDQAAVMATARRNDGTLLVEAAPEAEDVPGTPYDPGTPEDAPLFIKSSGDLYEYPAGWFYLQIGEDGSSGPHKTEADARRAAIAAQKKRESARIAKAAEATK